MHCLRIVSLALKIFALIYTMISLLKAIRTESENVKSRYSSKCLILYRTWSLAGISKRLTVECTVFPRRRRCNHGTARALPRTDREVVFGQTVAGLATIGHPLSCHNLNFWSLREFVFLTCGRMTSIIKTI